jgi:hypothetical protein
VATTTLQVVAGYGVRALAATLVEARRWNKAVPELRDYHAAKRAALLTALGADDTGQLRSGLDVLLDATVERLAGSASPFEVFLEALRPIVALYQRHGQDINAAAAGLRAALMALLVDLIVEVYAIPLDRSVTDEDLRQHGFDVRTPEPDPIDFW